MTRPTQTARIVRMLEVAGPSGITQLDMMRPLDGGPPIMALSQRIGDLRRAGERIVVETIRTPGGARCARYRLPDPSRDDSPGATVPGHNPPETSWQTTTAQPEENPLVQSSTGAHQGTDDARPPGGRR
ncbi:helix-turn-helix domain-containing protein [Patulibacter brassicae]|uniref:Helix-turn-helix domain-containing protein n=1 Tax=Patulibacter brassicae TaxID=1705717 RepID=A0ABU4VLR5_9ACTN|nr:helix-turn-helix domain-containing protein [Patulibacter brassicae]MDX8151876.1 helix-turn-helix domain-containing protein [Patulibacter brassicae]